jgi:hypothetical protein
LDFNGKFQAFFRKGFNHPNDRCASCHLEHLADTPVKTTVANAPAAPLPRTTPTLETVTGCTDCHAKLRERLDNTTVRDAPDWTHHPEFRPLIARTPFGSAPPVVDRISLVERPSDYTGLIFSHQEHLSAVGGVARMATGLKFPNGKLGCADCHRPDGSGGFERVEMRRDCSACHSLAFAPGSGGAPRTLPHGHPDQVIATLRAFYQSGGAAAAEPGAHREPPGFLAQLGRLFSGAPRRFDSAEVTAKARALFAPRGLCSECHAAVAPVDPSSLDYRIVPIHITQRYLPWGAFNHAVPEHNRDAEGRSTCETCHQASGSTLATDVALPRISECGACHGKSKAKVAAAASADCQECHSYHAPGTATAKGDQVTRGGPRLTILSRAGAGHRKLASATEDGRAY